jgi:heat-inducible transcriptional repressor
MSEHTINDRAQYLLKVLIERYIREGQPVGSKTLAEDSILSLSSATIRNIMAELEEKGFIHSPHTSAGRIPTELGYRFFVNSLLTIQPLDQAAIQQVEQELTLKQPMQGLISSASSLLSGLSRMAGLVTLPKRQRLILRQVEFLPLSERRILVILVLNESEVQNRVIYADKEFSAYELQLAANYLNSEFAGKDLYMIRKGLLTALQEDRQRMDQLLGTTIEVAEKAFTEPQPTDDYVVAGQAHLFDLANDTGVERVRQLFDAFSKKHSILHLLDQALTAEGVQIYIGGESGLEILNDCSVITAPYMVDNKVVGVLGVLGPTRMAYDKVIPLVDITAKLLSAALNKGN